MYYYLVAPTVIVRKNEYAFTYHSESKLSVGTLVRISIGKKESNGIVVGTAHKPTFKTKLIDTILSDKPLPIQLVKLAHWLSEYYSTPTPLVMQAILPTGLHKKRRDTQKTDAHASRNRTKIVLNAEQSAAIKTITAQKTGTVLLHGVTGGGKTHVYIEAAKFAEQHDRSTILLVPEIALTPQLVAEFANHFDNIIVTHSQMTEAERHKAWVNVHKNDKPVVIIGPRSALFMPVTNLGLIVIDECHEPSFKQDQSPRYSALRAASVLARLHNATTVLGSATPSVADYYLADKTNSPIIKIQQTARDTTPPVVKLIDSKKRDNFKEHRFISDELIAVARDCLVNNKQIMIFHNRRGTAPTTLCTQCGWTSLCSSCLIPQTLHGDKHKLICHLCGLQSNVPPCCPECNFPDVTFKGIGTKLIETEVSKIFPKARIARFDADNQQEETLAAKYQQIYDGEIDIIIGTQILAKGLDLPHLRVVGIIQADSGLNLPDYVADERVFQLIYQVSGRVGRGADQSHVVIQTFQPNHKTIELALLRNYDVFYSTQIEQRKSAALPPFVHLLKLVCTYKTESAAIKSAQTMSAKIKSTWPNVVVLGPTPAFYERLGGNYRWQLLVKYSKRAILAEIATSMPDHWQYDLDPASLL